MKTVKYILAILFLISVLANFIQGNFATGLIFLILGIILLPPIADKVKEKLKLWKNKTLRYSTYIFLFIMGTVFLVENTEEEKTTTALITKEVKQVVSYQEYLDQVQNNITLLSPERKKIREEIISDLTTNSLYQKLVIEKVVSPEYLPLLNSISQGIKTISKEGFSIDESFVKKINNSENGEEKIQFVVKIIALAIPDINGGLPLEIIQVFDRYKENFGVYGEKSVKYDLNKNQTEIDNFDLTPFFVMIEPKNKEYLNQFYEAKKKELSHWNEKGEYSFPYLATKEGYISYIKEVNPESPFIPKIDLEITAIELYKEYEANEVRADEKYKGKRIAVTGIIDMIGKDILDKPYISFRINYLQGVNAYFSKENNKSISQLNKGQKVTLIGTCQGMIITDVIMQDGELWE